MRCDKFTYDKVDGCFYEAMRVNIHADINPEYEGNANIDPTLSHLNVVVTKHRCMNPSNYAKHNRGVQIAEYHKEVTGKAARMQGTKDQQSKAIGFIITLPRNYFEEKIELSEEEENYLNGLDDFNWDKLTQGRSTDTIGMNLYKRLSKMEFNENERNEIITFLSDAAKAACEVANIDDEDILYSVIHFDESFPHIHCIGLSSEKTVYEENVVDKRKCKYNEETNQWTNIKGDKVFDEPIYLHKKGDIHKAFSTTVMQKDFERDATGKAINGFYFKLHREVVNKLKEKGYNKADLLLNGTSREHEYDIKYFQKEDRIAGALQRTLNSAMAVKKEKNKSLSEKYEEKAKISKTEFYQIKKENKKLKDELEFMIVESAAKENHIKILNEQLNDIEKKADECISLFKSLENKLNEIYQNLINRFKTQFEKVVNLFKQKRDIEANLEIENINNKLPIAVRAELNDYTTSAKQLKESIDKYKNTTFELTAQQKGYVNNQMKKLCKPCQIIMFEDPMIQEIVYEEYYDLKDSGLGGRDRCKYTLENTIKRIKDNTELYTKYKEQIDIEIDNDFDIDF